MIDELRKELGFSVDPMCRTLGVSKSGYYVWKNRKPSARRQEDERLKVAIRAAHERGRGTYGPEKIQDELLDVEKVEVGLNRIKRLRRQMDLRCKQVKKYKATTDSNHKLPVAPNLLNQDFAVSGPNRAWVADITYVATEEGWLYLAAIKDLWNREIIGYAMSHRMTQDLVGRALFRAAAARRPPEGLIHHSDRGSQYCSRSYQKLMGQFRMVPSMSRKGNCWDNASMESFFGTLKRELVHHRKYRTRQNGLAREIAQQYSANRAALDAALAEERSRLLKAKHELSAAEQVKQKLAETLPHYLKQEIAFEELAKSGFVSSLEISDKKRERIEKEEDLRIQEQVIESARASIEQSEKKLVQIETDYRRNLHVERNDIQGQVDKLTQEVAKQSHRNELMELKASQASIVKDIATHTAGTVVQPGKVLLTLVPKEEKMRAEVWVSNDDIGFVRQGQSVKLKIAAFPFQKYGMIEGTVTHVSADAADDAMGASNDPRESGQPLVYRALVGLKSMHLETDGRRFPLTAGMQTHAEIHLGSRTVMEYPLSPVRKAWHEAGRER